MSNLFAQIISQPLGGLPSNLIECEFIESSGHQFITLPYENGTFEHKLSFTSEARQAMGNCPNRGWFWEYQNGKVTLASNFAPIDMRTPKVVRYTAMNRDVSAGPTLDVEGVVLRWSYEAPSYSNLRYRLFRINDYASLSCYAKMYYCSVEVDGAIDETYICAFDKSVNRPCLYGMISKQRLYNEGTGEFGYMTKDGVYVAPV